MSATLTTRLALHLVCCARCSDLIPPDRAERTPSGDWHACAYRRAVHRRIADALADAA